jgi:GST-like protein
MFGQRGHFLRAAPEKLPYAIERYTNESRRLLNVIENRLAESPYLAGEYSIADMATYPWVVGTRREPEQLESRPNFKRWLDAIGERPAVKRGVAVMADLPAEPLDDAARSILYGAKQFERR